MRPACGNQDGIAYKPQQFAGIGVLHCAAAADVPGKQQGAELMVRKAFDRSCAFFPAHSIDQSGHQLLSRIALCKGRPLFLLSAKIPQVEFIVICHVELYSQMVQAAHQFGRSLRHPPDCIRVSKSAGSGQGICIMLLRAILLSLGIQGCIDSALCHNRLRPLGGKGGHQLYRPAVFHSSQSSGKPCQPCTHDHQSVFHTLFHPI